MFNLQPASQIQLQSHGIQPMEMLVGQKIWQWARSGSIMHPGPTLPGPLPYSRIRTGPVPHTSGSGWAAPHFLLTPEHLAQGQKSAPLPAVCPDWGCSASLLPPPRVHVGIGLLFVPPHIWIGAALSPPAPCAPGSGPGRFLPFSCAGSLGLSCTSRCGQIRALLHQSNIPDQTHQLNLAHG